MKKIEFLVELTNALKKNNRVSILELLVNEPFHARTCLVENVELQKQFKEHVKKEPFYKELLAVGNRPHIGELTSKPAFIVREIVKERVFSAYCSEKMHPTSDYLSTAEGEEGMKQVKKCETMDDDLLLKHAIKNHNVTDFLEIFANNDKTTKEYQDLTNPKIKITNYEDVQKVSQSELIEMLDQFDKKKLEYIRVKNEQAKPLWEEHKILTRKNPKIPEETTFEFINNYNLKTEDAEERELLVEKYKKIEKIKYE